MRPSRLIGCGVVLTALQTSSIACQTEHAVPTPDPSWLSANAGSKTVTFELTAGLTPINGALNFNGYHDGGLTVTVPNGWTMIWEFANHDGMLPHSAQVAPNKIPVPPASVTPAIARAYTDNLDAGIPPQGTDVDRFTVTPAGEYLIMCGVPGHALAGMWIRLEVSSTATEPAMAVTAVQ
jgi:sulfocyanin